MQIFNMEQTESYDFNLKENMLRQIKEVEQKWLETLQEELIQEMDRAPAQVSTHDINHIKRVWKYSKEIAVNMQVDWEILIAAVFLHDIGRHYPEGIYEHGPISAPFAQKVLERIDFPQEKIETTVSALKFHDESFSSDKRDSIEAKILYDADKLDVFGAIGITRYLIFQALRGKTLEQTVEYAIENLPQRFKRLEFEETKKIAKERYEYALDYFKKLKNEISN